VLIFTKSEALRVSLVILGLQFWYRSLLYVINHGRLGMIT
jgi:hypothetical protein